MTSPLRRSTTRDASVYPLPLSPSHKQQPKLPKKQYFSDLNKHKMMRWGGTFGVGERNNYIDKVPKGNTTVKNA
jgi:hypothetical protein